MFPKDVTHEGRRSVQKRFFAKSAHVFAPHRREIGRIDPFEAELPDRPIQPMWNVQFWPLAGICGETMTKNSLVMVSEGGLHDAINLPYTYYVNNSTAHL